MYYHIPPRSLYREYQQRVEQAVRNHNWRQDMIPVERPRGEFLLGFRRWLAQERERFIRSLQPAEEGYIA